MLEGGIEKRKWWIDFLTKEDEKLLAVVGISPREEIKERKTLESFFYK